MEYLNNRQSTVTDDLQINYFHNDDFRINFANRYVYTSSFNQGVILRI